jgi:hypothetical protein
VEETENGVGEVVYESGESDTEESVLDDIKGDKYIYTVIFLYMHI